ncbi:MAG: glycosyltransferase family 4 protein, partial [Clostridia bacterium]
MKKEYIMICLEKLGIGGVETAVINQIMAFIQKKYFVVVLSKDGIYRKDIEKIGAQFIEFDFEITNEFELIKSEKIKKLLVELNITQVHVHQFSCLNYIIPVCINMNIPYVLYIHVGILNNSNNVYNWFCENYPIYNFTFLYSFEFAYKIIAITESAKEYIVNRFNFDEKKCLVIPNCINFNNYISQKKVKTINNILIISRFSNEKTKLILNAIDLFFELKKITNNNKLSLTICGDGHEKNKIEQYINDNYKIAVNFIGETKNVFEVIDKNDCVISTDRCILEAMATKKIAVISTYDGLKGVIDKSNIKNVSISNFSANNLPSLNVNEIAKQISFLDESAINDI